MEFYSSHTAMILRVDMVYTQAKAVPIVKFDMPYDVYNPSTGKTESQWLRCNCIGERFEKLYTGGYLPDKRTIQVHGSIKTVAFRRNNGEPGSAIEMKVDRISFIQIARADSTAAAPASDNANDYYDSEKGTF